MTRIVRIAVSSLCVGFVVAVAPGAEAACHAFTVSVAPQQVDEGGTVTVTVERDAAVNPSSVRVRTVDGSARAPGDYAALDENVGFTTETSRTFEIAIVDDPESEGAESFSVQLSEPGGCAINQNFVVGDPGTVTIRASDAATPTATVPTAPPDPTRAPTAAPTPTPTTTAPSTPGSTSAPTTPSPSPVSDDDTTTTSGSGGLVAVAAVAVVLAGAGATMLWLRRTGRV